MEGNRLVKAGVGVPSLWSLLLPANCEVLLRGSVAANWCLDDEVQMQLSGLLRMGQQARLRALFQNDSISKHIKAQAERAQV